MKKEVEELQSLGVSGVFKESFNLIFTRPKIFTLISLYLLLPLSLIFLAHFHVSQLIFFNILHNQASLHRAPQDSQTRAILSDILFSQWTSFFLLKFAYFTFLLSLSLLSTSTVVYTVASIYASANVTFRKVMDVVSKVWSNLLITFNWNIALVFAYNVVSGLLFIFWLSVIGFDDSLGLIIGGILFLLYLIGFVYVTIIWHLASVISVLEDSHGRQAMTKGNELMKGKKGTSIVVSCVILLCFLGIQLGFEIFVVIGLRVGREVRIGVAILGLICLLMVILLGLVVQTVLYFVCKSYHHEHVDKSSLADHHGDYVPLRARYVQSPENPV
ncbi:uncharacterized protein LOC114749048 [Neltuma alba]|uniref:uncharacterized protein LOC114749048 n=1 Tax=Neltuma alba TaxID=207710 RepID=UPI0010A3FD15|nr:uncharacterized protein LOC114749048 [Prosopis alba]